ncbi:MAG TPA: hypothetical protein VD999_02020 [Vitreimonas sp.]|nr:hypothetical protein [Vitreimonas sp.]
MITAHPTPKSLVAVSCGLLIASVVAGTFVNSFGLKTSWAQVAEPTPIAVPTTTEVPGMADPTDVHSLTAIPPRLGENRELKAKPGETIQAVVRVRNGSNKPIFIKTSAQDFILSEDGQTPIPVQDNVSNRWSLASWMTLSTTSQRLGPNQSGNVNVVITVPADALPGGHYAMVMHEPTTAPAPAGSEEATAKSAALVSQRVGTLLYFEVEGPINEAAFVRNFSMPKFTEYGPVPFKFTVENMSDIHIRPQVGVEIYNIFNRKVDTIVIEPKNVFPFVAREFEGKWDRVWGIGPYRAKLTMSYGQAGAVVVAKTSFWLIPIKLVLAITTIFMSLLVVIIAVRRHLLHRQDAAQARIEMLEKKLQDLEHEHEL